MLSTNIKIKEATKKAHQELEAKVVRKLKAVRSDDDYAALLKHFYVYFITLEKALLPYINEGVLPDYALRRNSSYLKLDIEALGSTTSDLPTVTIPKISNTIEALAALYVMEGSIMGGPYIIQMLQKGGIDKGFSFFSGYGADTGRMWAIFTGVLNLYASDEKEEILAIKTADETFSHFSDVFGEIN